MLKDHDQAHYTAPQAPATRPARIIGNAAQIQAMRDAELVDAYAEADALSKRATEMREQARAALMLHAGDRTTIRSTANVVTITKQPRTGLDQAAIKRTMSAEWLKQHSTVTESTILRITALIEKGGAA